MEEGGGVLDDYTVKMGEWKWGDTADSLERKI